MKYILWVVLTVFISAYFTRKKGSFSFLGVLIATVIGVLILAL
ncbi:hypothetical protein ACWOCD_17965 [Enterococcus silesiacus]|nr:hypothetical protein [Enterococcus silesiacus]